MFLPSKFTICLFFTFAIFASSEAYADVSGSCYQIDKARERSKLQTLLSSSGISKEERAFLLGGVDRRLAEMRSDALSARGTQCGIDSVRALVLSCLSDTFPSAIRSKPAERKSSKALWGRAGLSVRGAVFIGMFHACRGRAAEIFLSD